MVSAEQIDTLNSEHKWVKTYTSFPSSLSLVEENKLLPISWMFLSHLPQGRFKKDSTALSPTVTMQLCSGCFSSRTQLESSCQRQIPPHLGWFSWDIGMTSKFGGEHFGALEIGNVHYISFQCTRFVINIGNSPVQQRSIESLVTTEKRCKVNR